MQNKQFESIIAHCVKPGRYIGHELNMIEKDPQGKVRVGLCFPDIYEVGMSHLGSRILYHLLNEREDTYCERVFAPWIDMEAAMREQGVRLFSLETKDDIATFELLGFTLQYEMSYTNILNMLDLAGVPLLSRERGEDMPFVMAGGPCTCNPEPLWAFIDFFVLGDGEEVIGEIVDAYVIHRQNGQKRSDFLQRVAQIKGVYVPSFYDVSYLPDGCIKEIAPNTKDATLAIEKRIVKDLENAYFPEKIIVPFMDIVHDRVTVEVFRGCTRGCRFCQAGMLYRPVRLRSPEKIMEIAKNSLACTGYEEVSLASLSTGDYPHLSKLVGDMIKTFSQDRISIALPSMRLDSFEKEVAEELQKVRKTGLTFAPEAGTQRLRDVINKNITEEEFENTMRSAFSAGWDSVKLYFMLGLPTETTEDIDGIIQMARKVIFLYREMPKERRAKPVRVTVSTSSFVPKPFTPFQWVGQDDMAHLREKQMRLRNALNGRGLQYSWHQAELSIMEAVFARGDRRLSEVLLKAYQNGCRFDGWQEHFRFDTWKNAMEEAGLGIDFYAHRMRDKDEVFPWAHLDMGVSREYLWKEYQNALSEKTTGDCRTKCLNCGITEVMEKEACPCVSW